MYTTQQAMEKLKTKFQNKNFHNIPKLSLLPQEWQNLKDDNYSAIIEKLTSIENIGILKLRWPKKPIDYLGVAAWIIPLEIEQTNLSFEQVNIYWEIIQKAIRQKEFVENTAPFFEDKILFELQPWYFMEEWKDGHYNLIRNGNIYYLYSLHFFADKNKYTFTDMSILYGLIDKEDKIELINRTRNTLFNKL